MAKTNHLLLEFAPMEGITTAAFRTAHHEVFGGADRYYAPFISTGRAFLTHTRDIRDISPENNRNVPVIPQLLSNSSADFIDAAAELAKLGYSEIDLNLGCPSPTVVTKHRGAGFLTDPDMLDRFFGEVFDALPRVEEQTGKPLTISVKTRIGLTDPAEADALMEVYNRYPLSLLIIHPRTQREQYRGSVHIDSFLGMLRASSNPVCYNGDLLTVGDVNHIADLCAGQTGTGDGGDRFHAVMIGRGAVRNPALFRMIRGGAAPSMDELRHFLARFRTLTAADIREEQNQLAKLKDLWAYLGTLFSDSGRCLKKIRKAKTMTAYLAAEGEILGSCPIVP